MNYSEKELAESVGVFLGEVLRLRPGESLLVYLDQGSDHNIVSAIRACAEERGGRAEILMLNPELSLDDQARQLAETIRQGAFDAACELSEQYFYRTSGWKVAREAGTRIYSLAGLDAASFIRCVGRVNHNEMFRFGLELMKVLQKSRNIRFFTGKGTDIRMQLRLDTLQSLRARFFRGPYSYILPPCGLLDEKTRATFLGGQVAFRGIPRTIEGTAVIDGYLWPPSEIGRLDEPLIVKIEKGAVVDIGGCPESAKIVTHWFEGQTIPVEHLCIGFNPGARLSGRILEAERVFGCISIGMGQGLSHTDGVIMNPSLEADQNVIEENGSFVSAQLLSLERGLLGPGQEDGT